MAEPTALRIAYLASVYGRVSDTFVRDEVAALREMGHDVRTFSIRRPASAEADSDEVRAEQARTTYILERGAGALCGALVASAVTHPLRTLAAIALWLRMWPAGRPQAVAYIFEAAYLARRLERSRVQLLHNHSPANAMIVATLAGVIAGVPVSHTVHGPYIFVNPKSWSLGACLRRARLVVCISDYCRRRCMEHTPESAWSRMRIVRCGLSPRFLSLASTPVPDSRRIVCVGRLCEEKGHAVLCDAATVLRGRGVEFELRVIGDGEMRERIERRVADAGLGDSVRLLGWMSSDAVHAELNAARGLVLPSFAEGLPVAIMEALAAGRPVISTTVAAIPELVVAGETGWLIEPGDADALADALQALLESPTDRLAAMGAAGAALVRERHDAAREAAALAEHFRACIDGAAS